MRALVVLFMVLQYGYWWLWQLMVLALAWDLWEAFLAPRPAIIVTKPTAQQQFMQQMQQPAVLPPDLTEVLAARLKCATENNCTDCKKFVAEVGGQPVPAPAQANHYEPRGYL